jgi:hypothetical protein
MARNVPPGASFAFTAALRTLDEQLRRIEALDSKAGVLIAADGLILALIAGEGGPLAHLTRLLTAGIVASVTISLFTALLSFTTRRYESAPNPDVAIHLMAAEPAWLEWRFLGSLQSAIHENRRRLRAKARLLSFALTALLLGSTLLGVFSLTSTTAVRA